MRTRSTIALLSPLLAGALVISGITPVAAAENVPDETAQLIQDVAPHQGEVLVGSQTETEVRTNVAGNEVAIPKSPGEPIAMMADGAPDDRAFQVNLPAEVDVKEGTPAADGTVVYEASGQHGASAAVQALDNGSVRIQTVTANAAGPHEFTYSFGNGYVPVEAADGSIALISVNEKGEITMATAGEAWARDANGKEVATHYEIEGELLIQVVEADVNTTYPVVADPVWAWYSAAYGAKFNRAETRSFANAGSVTGMCVALGRFGWGLAGVCAVYGSYIFAQAAIANGNGQCIFVAVAPAPVVFRYKDGDCR